MKKFVNKSNENARTFVRVMAQFIPTQTLQVMLMGQALEGQDDPTTIEYIVTEPIDVQSASKRIAQLEDLLKKNKIALPERESVKLLTENMRNNASNEPLDEGETRKSSTKQLVEHTQRESKPEKQKTATEILREHERGQMMKDESFVVTAEDD